MKSYLGLSAIFLSTLFFSAQANAENVTKIVTVAGQFSLKHKTSYGVHPEDSIDFGAQDFDIDEFDDLNNEELIINKSKERDPEDYEWSSNYSTNDSCDLSQPDSCVGSNFEPTPFGVTYSVPLDIGKSVVITVRSRKTGSYAEIVLKNKDYTGTNVAPQTAYVDASDYTSSNSDYDYNSMLTGHGQWKYNPYTGERVWVPYGYMPVSEWSTWTPYVHGHWVYTSYGWTWQSHDPFGFVTSHYGIWRYTLAFGWVWQPFPAGYVVYRPFVGTLFYTSTGIGWSPFWNGYWVGYTGSWNPYAYGYNEGYRDGYWDGYWAGRNSNNHYGWVYVSHAGFTSGNIYTCPHRETSYVTIVNNYTTVYAQGSFGSTYGERTYIKAHPTKNGELVQPGSMRDYTVATVTRDDSRLLVEKQLGTKITEEAVSVKKLNIKGGSGTVDVVELQNKTQLPEIYTKAGNQAKTRVRAGKTLPAGAVIDADSGEMTADASQVDSSRDMGSSPLATKNGHSVKPSKNFKRADHSANNTKAKVRPPRVTTPSNSTQQPSTSNSGSGTPVKKDAPKTEDRGNDDDRKNSGSTTKNTGSTSKSTGTTSKSSGSTTKSSGNDTRSTGSTTKNTGSTSKSTGSTTKSTGNTTKSTGSTSKSTGSSNKSTGSKAEPSRNTGSTNKGTSTPVKKQTSTPPKQKSSPPARSTTTPTQKPKASSSGSSSSSPKVVSTPSRSTSSSTPKSSGSSSKPSVNKSSGSSSGSTVRKSTPAPAKSTPKKSTGGSRRKK